MNFMSSSSSARPTSSSPFSSMQTPTSSPSATFPRQPFRFSTMNAASSASTITANNLASSGPHPSGSTYSSANGVPGSSAQGLKLPARSVIPDFFRSRRESARSRSTTASNTSTSSAAHADGANPDSDQRKDRDRGKEKADARELVPETAGSGDTAYPSSYTTGRALSPESSHSHPYSQTLSPYPHAATSTSTATLPASSNVNSKPPSASNSTLDASVTPKKGQRSSLFLAASLPLKKLSLPRRRTGAGQDDQPPPSSSRSGKSMDRLNPFRSSSSSVSASRPSLSQSATPPPSAPAPAQKTKSKSKASPFLPSTARTLLPDIIEITATPSSTHSSQHNRPRDEDEEERAERERLRDAAAQSIGFVPESMSVLSGRGGTSVGGSLEDDSVESIEEMDEDEDELDMSIDGTAADENESVEGVRELTDADQYAWQAEASTQADADAGTEDGLELGGEGYVDLGVPDASEEGESLAPRASSPPQAPFRRPGMHYVPKDMPKERDQRPTGGVSGPGKGVRSYEHIPPSIRSTLESTITSPQVHGGARSRSRSGSVHSRHSRSNSYSASLSGVPVQSSPLQMQMQPQPAMQSTTQLQQLQVQSLSQSLSPIMSIVQGQLQSPLLPSFPATYASLSPYISASATLPKYYPPSNLRMWALGATRAWKVRLMALSTPPPPPLPFSALNGTTTNILRANLASISNANKDGAGSISGSANGVGIGNASSGLNVVTYAPPAYLHLFKSGAPAELEIERLEINEDSVVFLTDNAPPSSLPLPLALPHTSPSPPQSHPTSPSPSSGPAVNGGILSSGKGWGIVKVGGIDVGARRKELNVEEGGRTMWLLRMEDASEAQRWIGVIKNAILSQRSVRAGLGVPTLISSPTAHEPRGDMDVMLSMRAQGIIQPSSSVSDDLPSSTTSPKPNFTMPDFTGSGGGTRSSTGRLLTASPVPPDQILVGPERSVRALPVGVTKPLSSGSSSHSPNLAQMNGHGHPQGSSANSVASITPSVNSNGPVSALKGLFSSAAGRPRSPSRSTSPDIQSTTSHSSTPTSHAHSPFRDVYSYQPPSPGVENDSFGYMGANLLQLLRTNDSAEAGASSSSLSRTPTSSTPPKPLPTPPGGLPRLAVTAPNSGLSATMIGRRAMAYDVNPLGNGKSSLDGNRSSEESSDREKQEHPRSMSTGSLSPPPRKRPWTTLVSSGASSAGNSSSRPGSSSGGTAGIGGIAGSLYNQHNSSVAGSFGLSPSVSEAQISTPTSIPLPLGSHHSALSSPGSGDDGRASSLYSVSTLASNTTSDRERRSSKRWSRHGSILAKRGTPPNGAPSAPISLPSSRPGSSGSQSPMTARPRTPQRSYTNESMVNRMPKVSLIAPPNEGGPSNTTSMFSKRASISSALSDSSGGSMQSPSSSSVPQASHSGFATHRSSIPPPQRPAPTFAPPPVPSPDPEQNKQNERPAASQKISFRESLSQRAARLSLVSPKPPPSSVLPPRPDEQPPPYHPRTLSGNGKVPLHLHSILASPAPPPNRPLPTVPGSGSSLSSKSVSIKRRLRILSAPPAPSPLTPVIQDDTTPEPTPPRPVPLDLMPSPTTPINERIAPDQNDPDFLSMYSVDTPISTSAMMSHDGVEAALSQDKLSSSTGLTSLSPPPRRTSRQMAVSDRGRVDYTNDDARGQGRSSERQEERKLITLSQHGSVVSLGFVSV